LLFLITRKGDKLVYLFLGIVQIQYAIRRLRYCRARQDKPVCGRVGQQWMLLQLAVCTVRIVLSGCSLSFDELKDYWC